MSDYKEYAEKAAKGGHKRPGPGGDASNGASSGCMVVAPAAIVAGLLLKVVARHVRSSSVR